MHGTRQILFVQGGGEGVHDEWDSHLVDSLRRELGEGYEIEYPRMPNEGNPQYEPWKAKLEREFRNLKAGAILVGHSVGGTILVNRLAERPLHTELGALFLLAAPFIGDGGWRTDDVQFPSDLGARLPRDVPIHFYHGLDDRDVPPSHVDLYERAVPQAHIHRLRGVDHQFKNDLAEVARAIASLGPRR
jgi:predicted alpha/beta hydrolase family esterase